MNEYLLLGLFFFIALFYSSIGFGGGSSYLALLSIVLTNFFEIRTLVLILNIAVVSIGTSMYIRQKVFNWQVFWPFILLSIPMAFLGARLRLSETTFFIVLGSALILSAIAMILQTVYKKRVTNELTLSKRLSLGGAIGFLSGLVGIGGGIFLSPTLNLMGWKNSRLIAALASIFILMNSLAGITGLLVAGTFQIDLSFATKIIVVVIGGGLAGSTLSLKIKKDVISAMTATLVMYVGLRLVLLHGFEINI
jgi:uncharacterized membrane protein YfcA